jgi:hypothetical protein
MEYICVGIGTGPMANVHTTFLTGYAAAFGLPHGTKVVDMQEYVCIGVGTGPHRDAILLYATVFGLATFATQDCC